MGDTTINAIPSKEEFDALPTKQDRKDMLKLLLREFPQKQIRDAWGMIPNSFYNMMHRYGLAGKKNNDDGADDVKDTGHVGTSSESKEQAGSGRKKRAYNKSGKYSKTATTNGSKDEGDNPDIVYHSEGEGGDDRVHVPGDTDWSRNPRRNIIDAEYTEIKEEAPKANSGALVAFSDPLGQPVEMPFPSLKGKPSQLLKQLQAVVMFLEAEGEDTRFRIDLKVYKEQ